MDQSNIFSVEKKALRIMELVLKERDGKYTHMKTLHGVTNA
jgi:hypothetical protein